MPGPNVVVILADDMGYGDFGAFNEGLTRTPHLDALAGESLCLTQGYAGSCVCAPSRAALLTGRYPHRTGAIDTREHRGTDRLGLQETTLAELLGRAGHATGMVGKWHLGELDERYLPQNRGFDEVCAFRGGWQDYWDWWVERNGDWAQGDGRYLTDLFTDEAVGFINRHAREPFLLYLGYNCPHTPLQCPEEDIAPFRDNSDLNEAVATLYGMIARMDAGIGRVLEALDRHGLREDTLVIFSSDNGPQFGSEIGDTHRFNCNFNGGKGNVYEGGIRVPLTMRWPDGGLAGGSFDGMAHFCDLLPTLMAVVGEEPPGDLALDGANILPALRGEPCDIPDQRFWQWNRYTPLVTCNAAMRDGDWKLVRPPIREAMQVNMRDREADHELRKRPGLLGPISDWPELERDIPAPDAPLLFNIADDPGETRDLAGKEPERVTRMIHGLEAWFDEVEAERLRNTGGWA